MRWPKWIIPRHIHMQNVELFFPRNPLHPCQPHLPEPSLISEYNFRRHTKVKPRLKLVTVKISVQYQQESTPSPCYKTFHCSLFSANFVSDIILKGKFFTNITYVTTIVDKVIMYWFAYIYLLISLLISIRIQRK